MHRNIKEESPGTFRKKGLDICKPIILLHCAPCLLSLALAGAFLEQSQRLLERWAWIFANLHFTSLRALFAESGLGRGSPRTIEKTLRKKGLDIRKRIVLPQRAPCLLSLASAGALLHTTQRLAARRAWIFVNHSLHFTARPVCLISL